MEGQQAPGTVLEKIWEAWRVRDRARTLAYFADDACFSMYLPQDVLPYGGEARGKPAISDRLMSILEVLDTLQFEGRLTKAVGEVAYGIVHYEFRHKLSDEVLDGTMRHIAHVRGGLISDLKEYHDVEKVRAFMQMVAYTAAARSVK